MKRFWGIYTLFMFLALGLIGCATPTEVEVTREVVVTQAVETVVEVTREVPVEVTRLVEVEPESSVDPFRIDSINDEIIIETIQPEAFDETFRLYISLPLSYESDFTKTYPVLYLMDGNFDTHMANFLVWNMKYEDAVPDLIIVGVGYDTNSEEELIDLRERDLIPDDIEGKSRTEDLLAFMQNELLPHIDSTYRTNPEQRYLAGFSAGGVFTLYAMFHAPELFEGFIATSPPFQIGRWSAFSEAEAYSADHTALPANLFVSKGSEESSDLIINRFTTRMNEYGFENFKMKTVVFAGETHVTMAPVGLQRGIKEIFHSSAWEAAYTPTPP